MTRRPPLTWDAVRLAELQRMLDVCLADYISQCCEAQDRAPDEWRTFWADEAEYYQRLRSSVLRRVQDWIDYASGKYVEMLSPPNENAGRPRPPAE